MIPNDQTLTTSGMRSDRQGHVLLLACGALAREIVALIDQNNWTHLDLQCLPAIYHNHPEKIVPAIEAAVAKHRADYTQVFVVYADCGTGGQLQAACDQLGIEMVPGPHCYAFFAGTEQFSAQDSGTAFYLTDFLVRQFDAFVWEPLGFAKYPDKFSLLRDMYFGNYETLIYQAQTEDAALTEKAKTCAARLGLTFERQFTGYGDLKTALQTL